MGGFEMDDPAELRPVGRPADHDAGRVGQLLGARLGAGDAMFVGSRAALDEVLLLYIPEGLEVDADVRPLGVGRPLHGVLVVERYRSAHRTDLRGHGRGQRERAAPAIRCRFKPSVIMTMLLSSRRRCASPAAEDGLGERPDVPAAGLDQYR
jgi:hypothetical protein